MIPSNTFTPVAQPADFIVPYDRAYRPLQHYSLGGIAIGDASRGRDYQVWKVTYMDGEFKIQPEGGAVVFSLPATNVQNVSLAFDTNMGIVLAWMSDTGGNLYYFNTDTATYTTRNFPDFTSCRVCIDDAREVNTTNSDVILGYTRAGALYWRQQRDKYNVERFIANTPNRLVKMGPSESRRLQFALLPF